VPKLTLSVDGKVIAGAKRYAEEKGTSVSQLVEAFLGGLSSSPPPTDPLPPITRRLHGVLRGAALSSKEYRNYLARKYR
jgi:hypothetical protein